MSDPKAFGSEAGSAPGVDALRGLLHAGLASPDEIDQLRPQLAESVPSVENGLWKLLPDGRMETTWKIHPSARWHDGTPFTSDDVLFTAQARLGLAEALLDRTLTPTLSQREREQAGAQEHLDFAIDQFRAMKMEPSPKRALSQKAGT